MVKKRVFFVFLFLLLLIGTVSAAALIITLNKETVAPGETLEITITPATTYYKYIYIYDFNDNYQTYITLPCKNKCNKKITTKFVIPSNWTGNYYLNVYDYSTTKWIRKDFYVTPICADTCASKGYSCGTWTICEASTNCGTCSTGYTCSNGVCIATCTDECTSGSRVCEGDGYKTCGYYDADSCLEWSGVTNCLADETCVGGDCVASCTNECSPSGSRVCEGDGYKTCGYYDADSCLEWSGVTNCLTGQICLDGTCVASGIYAGLVSWWKMDNVSGNQLIDSRGLHNGTLMNDSHIESDSVRGGKVLKLDGINDYVNIGAFDETENLNEFTISFWIKAAVADDTSTRYVFYKASNIYMYRSSSEYYYFIVFNKTSGVSRGTLLAPKDTNWHHIVAVYNGTNVFTYIDMNKSALTKFSGETRETISSFTISYPSSTIAFNGSIDDFMFYNRALSAEEIQELHDSQTTPTTECEGTDTSCGVYPACTNCNLLDGSCVGASQRDYYCSGTSCLFTLDSCTDCSCTCGGYGIIESTANGNCVDGIDNDCDNFTDNDPECGEITEITECKLLSQPNKLYVLNQDIVQSLDETCIVISAENTTIDCKGHSITSDFSRTGIYSYARNTTIKNCNISMGEAFTARGIELNGANNSYIHNNTLNDQGIGLFVMNTNYTIIEQNIINSVIFGIYLTTSNENTLESNKLSSNLYGIYLTTSNENTLESNKLSSNLYGIYLTTSNENTLKSNKLSSNLGGIYLTTSNENTLESNKLSTSTYAVYIRNSLDINITRNTMNLNHYGIYLSSILGPNKYQFNGNELNDNLNTDIINTKFISESTERIYNKGQQISFDLNITHINGSSSDDFIYDVSFYPGEEYTAIKNNNILTISFTPTKEGLYSFIANITTSSGNTEIRKFIFLVGNINSGIIRYYFHDDPSTHGQPFDTPWVGQDYGSMLSYPVDEEEYRTCGEWVQFHPDEILKPVYIIKNVSINWWYKVSADPYDPYTPYVGIERYATPSEVYDYMVLIPSTLNYTWGQVKFTNLNLTSDYLWRPYWLGIKLGGKSPFVMSNSSNPSYADFTYLYAGPKIEKFKGIGSGLGNVNLLSSVFKDDSKNNAFLQLEGEGTFNIVVQMPDIFKDYEVKMDGIDCSSSANCELNSQLNGELDLNLILNGQHILEIIYEEGGTDYTDRSCNVDGSASSTKVKCGLGSVNKNEDSTDATSDSCVDGTSNSYMHIEDIFVDATTVSTIDTVQVKCEVCCYSSGTEYAIFYNNGSGWVNKKYGNCINGSSSSTCTFLENKTINVPVDDVVGTHYFRCWESYSSCTATNLCCNSTYGDNDDMSIKVI